MVKQTVIVLGLFSAALLIGGLILGFRPVSDAQGYKCGSAFRENPHLLSEQLFDTMQGGTGETSCDKERSDALVFPVVLLLLGAAGGVSTIVFGRQLSSRETANTPDAT